MPNEWLYFRAPFRFTANVKTDLMSDKLVQGVDEESCREGIVLYQFKYQNNNIMLQLGGGISVSHIMLRVSCNCKSSFETFLNIL